MRKKAKTTSLDIAHLAAVPQAIVPRVGRGSPLVKPVTRKRIQHIARTLSYRVDRSAASIRRLPDLPTGCDRFSGGRIAAHHLIRRGRRRIAFLGGVSSLGGVSRQADVEDAFA